MTGILDFVEENESDFGGALTLEGFVRGWITMGHTVPDYRNTVRYVTPKGRTLGYDTPSRLNCTERGLEDEILVELTRQYLRCSGYDLDPPPLLEAVNK